MKENKNKVLIYKVIVKDKLYSTSIYLGLLKPLLIYTHH